MTNSVHMTHDDSTVAVNPFVIFITIFVMPYALFFLLMMALTGLAEPMLIVDAIIKKSSIDFVKVWVIGSFILSIIMTLYLSGMSVTQYVYGTFQRETKRPSTKQAKEDFVIRPSATVAIETPQAHSSVAKLPVKQTATSILQSTTTEQMAKRYEMLDKHLS